MKIRVCVFTGARSDYGIMKPLLKRIYKDILFDLILVVSGMHLSREFGMTVDDIERDGFKIFHKVEILVSSDTPFGMLKSMGIGLVSFSEVLSHINPDFVILLGDRFETLAFAISCFVLKIPIVHLYGGEITEGALDDSFRHSITKMSWLHFTATEEYRKNVIQLGEDPSRVFNVGALGLDNISKLKLLSKKQVEKMINRKFKKRNFLITYHPATLDECSIEEQVRNLIMAIDSFNDTLFIFTKSNADFGGRLINDLLSNYVNSNPEKAVLFDSMGELLYLSTMKYVDLVIGNSSSGIIEAPSFKIPTINIGNRQSGRIKAKSVIDCSNDYRDIIKAINIGLDPDFRRSLREMTNPYGDGKSAEKIIKIIKKNFTQRDFKKKFYKVRFDSI
ncbi:MAG: UDP-N-acetylglucosamine 2-epimerase [bacterium]|nr:UDP-N-acetylglucosamine 2-epimerase [bacterium]